MRSILEGLEVEYGREKNDAIIFELKHLIIKWVVNPSGEETVNENFLFHNPLQHFLSFVLWVFFFFAILIGVAISKFF